MIPRASIWPTVSFDTTSVGGMANARAWVASLLEDEPAGRNVRVVQRATDCHRCKGRGFICVHCGPRVDWHHEMDCGSEAEEPCPVCSGSLLVSPRSAAEPTEAPTDHPNPETGVQSVLGHLSDRAIYGPKHGDQWTVRNGQAVVVGSNDWPPPKPGTHESDLDCEEPPYWGPTSGAGTIHDYITASLWSRPVRTTP